MLLEFVLDPVFKIQDQLICCIHIFKRLIVTALQCMIQRVLKLIELLALILFLDSKLVLKLTDVHFELLLEHLYFSL